MSPVPNEVKPLVRYWPANNKNFGPKFVRSAMPWFETFWHAHSRYPSDGEIMERFGATLEQVRLLNAHKFWLNCLERRGIARPGISEWVLTDRQIAAVALLTNFHHIQDPLIKLSSLGVTEEELQGWYRNQYFKEALRSRADTVLEDVAPDATVELARLIKKGNFPAIKFYYEITGRAQSPEAVNVKQTMQVLIEAVQKHVKDPEVLQKIAGEVQSVRSIQGL